MSMREKYQNVLVEYSKMADEYSEKYARTSDAYYKIAYHQITSTICTLKSLIKAQEESRCK